MKSRYHLDSQKFSLQKFQQDLGSRELIPSRVALKQELKTRFAIIHSAGVNTLGNLIGLSDLSRLYGVGPVFARLLYDLGIDSVKVFTGYLPEEIVKIYEDKTKKKADFTVSDIRFTLNMARNLD